MKCSIRAACADLTLPSQRPRKIAARILKKGGGNLFFFSKFGVLIHLGTSFETACSCFEVVFGGRKETGFFFCAGKREGRSFLFFSAALHGAAGGRGEFLSFFFFWCKGSANAHLVAGHLSGVSRNNLGCKVLPWRQNVALLKMLWRQRDSIDPS